VVAVVAVVEDGAAFAVRVDEEHKWLVGEFAPFDRLGDGEAGRRRRAPVRARQPASLAQERRRCAPCGTRSGRPGR
jgi:hypothetical protein